MLKGSWYHESYGGVKSPWMKIDRVRAHLLETLDWHYELVADDSPRITVEDVMGRSRKAHIVRARGDIIRRLRFDCKWSYPRIGAFMQRDHTTIMHHCVPFKGATTWSDRAQWLEFIRRQEVAEFRSVSPDVKSFEAELEVRKLMREQAILRQQMRARHLEEIEATYAAE